MSTNIPQQLLLGVKLNDDATFDNFFVSSANRQLLEFLHDDVALERDKLLFLWGGSSTGKSHLLQALCHANSASVSPSIYLPMKDCHAMDPEILSGLDNLSLICLDDIEEVLGVADWEQALFHLLNDTKQTETVVVFSSQTPPPRLQVTLMDLGSRLQASMVFQLHGLDDEEKADMFKQRAKQLGIEIADPVIDYIMQRSNRDVSALMTLLHQLDDHSLEQKRRITIPMVKQSMGW